MKVSESETSSLLVIPGVLSSISSEKKCLAAKMGKKGGGWKVEKVRLEKERERPRIEDEQEAL